jgi:hypothetical protein
MPPGTVSGFTRFGRFLSNPHAEVTRGLAEYPIKRFISLLTGLFDCFEPEQLQAQAV